MASTFCSLNIHSLGLTMTSTGPSGTGCFCIGIQALRTWLLSRCPSGTKYIHPPRLCLSAYGLKPWERHPQRNRPERAPEKTLATTYIYVVLMCDVPVFFPPDCARGLLYEGSAAVPAYAGHSAAPSGRFSRGRLPRAEALGCSVFALRARAECPNSTSRLGVANLSVRGSVMRLVQVKRLRPPKSLRAALLAAA
jgi:hypothetical protein